MNWDQIQGNWKEFKGNVRSQWGKLTDDDLEKIESQLLQIVLTPYIGAEEGARVASAAGEG